MTAAQKVGDLYLEHMDDNPDLFTEWDRQFMEDMWTRVETWTRETGEEAEDIIDNLFFTPGQLEQIERLWDKWEESGI